MTAYKPLLDWDAPSPCQCCGGKRAIHDKQAHTRIPCPDCRPAVEMAKWPGGIGEQVEF